MTTMGEMKLEPDKVIARILARSTSQANGCRVWDAGRTTDGYGKIKVGKHRTFRAHRLMWLAKHGAIPAGKVVCHKCDNRACVEPSHLFLGSQSDNIKDAVAKGRHFTPWRNDA